MTINPPLSGNEELQQWFGNVWNMWTNTQVYSQLSTILGDSYAILDCTKIIGFSLGDFSRKWSNDYRERVALSHALLLSVTDIVNQSKLAHGPFPCYVQDRWYTEATASLLSKRGVNVLEDPKGFLLVDEYSAVIACGANMPIKQIVTDLARPAVIIWDKIREPYLDSR